MAKTTNRRFWVVILVSLAIFLQHAPAAFARGRMYHPEQGRFMQRDPIEYHDDGMNLYQYVRSDPVNRVDPFGLNSMAWDLL